MAIITALTGQEIIVDDERYDDLVRYKWRVDGNQYPKTWDWRTQTYDYMHKMIYGNIAGQRLTTYNGNKLDMRYDNIKPLVNKPKRLY